MPNLGLRPGIGLHFCPVFAGMLRRWRLFSNPAATKFS